MPPRCLSISFCLGLAIWLAATSAAAAPGDLDVTWNSTGKLRGGIGGGHDDARAVAVQGDGKLVVAGTGSYQAIAFFGTASTVQRVIVARYETDGSLDRTFGAGTGAIAAPSPSNAIGQAVAIQSDGKIVVAGYEYTFSAPAQLTVYRFHADGSPDTSFGNDGIARPSFGTSSFSQGLLLQADKIVVFGQIGSSFAVIRLNSNGSLDSTFGGGDGVANISFAGIANGGALQPTGAILATGGFCPSGGLSDCNVAVVRLNGADGAVDTSFDGDGIAITSIPSSSTEYGNAVRTQPGNSTGPGNPDEIVVVGVSGGSLMVVRYNLNGSLDTTLDGDGILLASIPGGNAVATGVAFETAVVTGAATRIIVSGQVGMAPNRDFLVVKLFLLGTFDTAFDGDGIVTTDISASDDIGNAMLLRSGRILVAGSTAGGGSPSGSSDLVLARYNLSNGALDTTFDSDGKMTDDVFDLPATARGVAVQPDGKVVVAGSNRFSVTSCSFIGCITVPRGHLVVARYHADGSPDHSFGGDGSVSTNFSGFAVATAVALQSDGRVVVAGSIVSGQDGDFLVARFGSDGAIDSGFGGGAGAVAVSFGSKVDIAHAVALQPDGKIVVAGSADVSTTSTPNLDFAVARLNTDGSPDTSFSGDGKLTTVFGTGPDEAKGVIVQDGKIVVCGSAFNGANDDLAAARYTATGTTDFGFGVNGKVMVDLTGAADSGNALLAQGDKLVVGGTAGGDLLLTRLNANGSIDGAFGSGGLTIHHLGGQEFGQALAVLPDGKLVLAGFSTVGGETDFATARYNANGISDTTYGSNGAAFIDNFGSSYAVALDALGRAVVAGESGSVFGIGRLLGDAFLRITSITRLSPDVISIEGLGVPGLLQTIGASSSLSSGTFPSIGTAPAGADGQWTFEESGLTSVPVRFYRASVP